MDNRYNREKQLENAVLILSSALISTMRIIWDLIPHNRARTILSEVEGCLDLIDLSKTKVLRDDINRIRRNLNKHKEEKGYDK